MIKATIGLFATWGGGYFARIDHTPLQSFYDTTGRTVDAYINCPFPIGTGVNAPRLYYKLWDGSYNHVNPYFVYQNNYRFNIPGQPHGSKISYYLAAQDSAGTLVFTFPSGGSGVNPPGTTPPPQMFIYYIWTNKIVSSSTVPKPITGMLTTDTIRVLTSGIVVDVNVTLTLNHSNDGDLILSLKRLSNTSNLSQYNGTGGQNFTNTIFDDSALISISQGNPPLTGRFKPQTPLSALKGLELSGDWVLRIYDRGSGNTGTLLNWSMEIVYAPGVSVRKISEIIPDKFVLSQNYPNPFNPVTKIKYDIPKSGFVKLVIFDALGREVETLVNEKQSAGSYEAVWDALLYTSGVYFYRLTADGYINTKRMILIK
ncbi:T9SS C-terminal target domain-containing protein [bacterium]|nr:MAG: T9SS C-terminal target domain-containing protein [bacterium]